MTPQQAEPVWIRLTLNGSVVDLDAGNTRTAEWFRAHPEALPAVHEQVRLRIGQKFAGREFAEIALAVADVLKRAFPDEQFRVTCHAFETRTVAEWVKVGDVVR